MNIDIIWNIGLTLGSVLLGWALNSISKTVASLQSSDKELSDKVNSIEVLVAGQYVRKSELQLLSDALFAKLDRIEIKLDRKVDK